MIIKTEAQTDRLILKMKVKLLNIYNLFMCCGLLLVFRIIIDWDHVIAIRFISDSYLNAIYVSNLISDLLDELKGETNRCIAV
jgi:hypothetical protein